MFYVLPKDLNVVNIVAGGEVFNKNQVIEVHGALRGEDFVDELEMFLCKKHNHLGGNPYASHHSIQEDEWYESFTGKDIFELADEDGRLLDFVWLFKSEVGDFVIPSNANMKNKLDKVDD